MTGGRRSWRAAATALLTVVATGCGSPTQPTPPPPAAGPTLACPGPLAVLSTSALGVLVNYLVPSASGGAPPVAVGCSPGPGEVFPPGPTRVSCTATDATMLTATCGFEVSVTLVPQIARTTFLAFGDSVTEGEVTAPAVALAGAAPILRQVVVPSASYPTVLESRLAQRYRAQRVTVENAGRSREWAADALPRFRAALATSRPGAVLLLMGYNELGSSAQRLEAVAALDRMAKEARAAGARVFIATLTPGVDGRERAPNPLAVLAMNDALRALAAGESAVLVDLYQAVLPFAPQWIGSDGLHPTEQGYTGIAEAFFAAIRADLEVR